jgi:hypothetical protein
MGAIVNRQSSGESASLPQCDEGAESAEVATSGAIVIRTRLTRIIQSYSPASADRGRSIIQVRTRYDEGTESAEVATSVRLNETRFGPKKSRPQYISAQKFRHVLMHWMSVKLPDNFQMRELSWPCRFHINDN